MPSSESYKSRTYVRLNLVLEFDDVNLYWEKKEIVYSALKILAI